MGGGGRKKNGSGLSAAEAGCAREEMPSTGEGKQVTWIKWFGLELEPVHGGFQDTLSREKLRLETELYTIDNVYDSWPSFFSVTGQALSAVVDSSLAINAKTPACAQLAVYIINMHIKKGLVLHLYLLWVEVITKG